jgi:hypothetical protein
VPGGGAPFGFDQPCKVHDYGYDLLRYAHATGQQLTAEARRQIDAMFARDLHARCQVIGRGLAGAGCHLVAELFTAGVSFNSWRQHHGNPADERLPGWTLGLAIPVLVAPFPTAPSRSSPLATLGLPGFTTGFTPRPRHGAYSAVVDMVAWRT